MPKKQRRSKEASLDTYASKRDFARTPEPEAKRGAQAGRSRFVVQKHAARRLHFDLRLELDGVLKSWAITRGPSLTRGEKRLAIRTEDHPLEYLTFEGNVPKGEYGGGSMIVWDRGRWVPEFDPHKGMEKGHLAFTLEGGRLKGKWHLVRIRPRRGERNDPWLLIKSEDEFSRAPGEPEITEQETTSFKSGLTTDELAAKGTVRQDHKARLNVASTRKLVLPDIRKVNGARKKILPSFVEPSLAAVCEKPPSGAKWVHEIKFDGYRIQARIDGGKIRLKTRKGLDWTERFKAIAEAIEPLGLASALLDGEIVVEDASGIANFGDLQADLSAERQDRFRYRVFDILYAEGFDLTPATLGARKALLATILAVLPSGSPVQYSEHLEQDGPTMLKHACRLGLEGIVSKRVDLPYRSGRGDHWLKSKCTHSQEFVILGYAASTVAAGSVGALLLGYREAGKLHYAGRVGTGWSAELAKSLRSALEAIPASRPALANELPKDAEKGVRWAEPQLVCEVQYRGWTADSLLRQASFKGIREDKAAEDVGLEEKKKRGSDETAARIGLRLTHPERLLWDEGTTKQGLADFYTEIADWILPHTADRVLSLLRRPGGSQTKGFFAKHPWAGLSDAVRLIEVGEKEPMLAISDLAGLLDLVQAGVVEIHPWGSTIRDLEHPDRLIFDLDPGDDVTWSAVIAAAKEIRQRLEDLDLECFVKTSGGKGLHVVLPIAPHIDWDEAKDFTRSIAEAMAKDAPSLYVATMTKAARRGRIFIDYFRNGRGATAVGAYSTRALPHAPISTPLAWDELSEAITSDHFRVENLMQRRASLGADPWRDIDRSKQRLPASRARR